jgi:hypothetical protein
MHRNRNLVDAYRRILLTAIVVVSVLAPAAAMAASPTSAQYDDTLQLVSQGGGGGGTGTASTTSGGGLPFTGLDVAVLAAIALALTAAGLVLRRHRPAGSSGQQG